MKGNNKMSINQALQSLKSAIEQKPQSKSHEHGETGNPHGPFRKLMLKEDYYAVTFIACTK
jgi:hypothetical protein